MNDKTIESLLDNVIVAVRGSKPIIVENIPTETYVATYTTGQLIESMLWCAKPMRP